MWDLSWNEARYARRKRLTKAMHALIKAETGDDPAALLAHHLRERWIVDETAEYGAQCVDVLLRKGETVDLISNQVCLTADVIGDDYSAAGAHCFVHDEAPGFVNRRKNEYIAQIRRSAATRSGF